MITSILALLSIATPSPIPTVSGTFNYISTANANHPSISADGTKIAYQVLDTSTDYSHVHVYDTSTSTDTVVSTQIHCCLPRISRDGTAVTYYAGYQTSPTTWVMEPMIASTTATGTETLVLPVGSAGAWGGGTQWLDPPPGISDYDSTTSTWRVAFVDPLGDYIDTSDCAPSGGTGTAVNQYASNAEEGVCDIDSAGDVSSIVWEEIVSGPDVHIYRGGVDMTAPATQNCMRPATDAAGDEIVFYSTDTAMVASTPASSPNVFTIVVSTDTIAVPYTCPGSSPYGACEYPAISADGNNIAFACDSMSLNFGVSGYSYGASVPNPSFGAVMMPFSGSTGPIFYSCEEANNSKVMPGYFPTVSNPTSASPTVPVVAFYGNTSPRADIITSLSGDYIYYVQ